MSLAGANLAVASDGVQIVLASSSDDRHPPSNIIDGYLAGGMGVVRFAIRWLETV